MARDRQQRNALALENVSGASPGFQITLPAEADLEPRILEKAEKLGRRGDPLQPFLEIFEVDSLDDARL